MMDLPLKDPVTFNFKCASLQFRTIANIKRKISGKLLVIFMKLIGCVWATQ